MFWEPFKLKNGETVVVPDGVTIKQALMELLIRATLAKGEKLEFEEVKRDLNMPNPNDFAYGFGSFTEAAEKAWSKAQRIMATQRETETETGEIATEKERESKMARQKGTGAKKAGRPTKYSDNQIRAMMEEYFKSHGELPGFATFKKEHPDVTIRLDRFREIVCRTDPDVLGWVYEETSGEGGLEASEESEGSGAILASEGLTAGDEAADSEAASDGVVSEPEEPIEVPGEVFKEPETADLASGAEEVVGLGEDAVAEAPQGEVAVIDSGTDPEGGESDGSGAILAPEEPTKEDTVGLETADSVSGEDSDGKETPDDEGKPEDVDSAGEPEKIDGKVVPVIDGFDGYGGVAFCRLSGDNYSISPNIMSCGGKRSMELKLCTIPAMDGGSIDLSVAISGDRDPSSMTPCDNGSDLRVVMKDAMTTFHIKGMGLSEYSLNRSVRNRRASLTVATIKRSLKIVFENCSVITVRDDVVDNMSGEFTLAIEAKVGAIYMCAGCEFEAISDSTEKSSKA